MAHSTMMQPIRNRRRLLLVLLSGPIASAVGVFATEPVVDQSYVARTGERVIQQSVVLDEPLHRVWDLYTTAAGLESWAAPKVEVDLRIGGSIRSNFKVGADIGEPGTVVTHILNLIPEQEIALRDDLVNLLTMGGLFEWLDLFPQEFLTELESEGDDVYTTTRFEAVGDRRTRLTVFAYGYGEGASWDRVFEETKKSNLWFFDNLSNRLTEGPRDWTKQ